MTTRPKTEKEQKEVCGVCGDPDPFKESSRFWGCAVHDNMHPVCELHNWEDIEHPTDRCWLEVVKRD